jgi:hypothetical protein
MKHRHAELPRSLIARPCFFGPRVAPVNSFLSLAWWRRWRSKFAEGCGATGGKVTRLASTCAVSVALISALRLIRPSLKIDGSPRHSKAFACDITVFVPGQNFIYLPPALNQHSPP